MFRQRQDTLCNVRLLECCVVNLGGEGLHALEDKGHLVDVLLLVEACDEFATASDPGRDLHRDPRLLLRKDALVCCDVHDVCGGPPVHVRKDDLQ